MAQTYQPEVAELRLNAASKGAGYGVGAAAILFVTCLSLIALYQQSPPRAIAADAPPEVFSEGRALEQLKKIGQSPHPIGSVEHARVRERILQELVAQGLEPEVQTTTSMSARRSNALRAATVHNIIARLKGSASQKAVLVAGHYDTVPNSPGAADDGSAVAIMLETLHALKAGSALQNDVIFLFTDGEEIGLLGAKAFADEHPAAKDVGVALNLEARGSGGPSIMFETSKDNGWLIEALAEAAPHPRANSLAYEVYKLLPNDTDLSIFKEAGLPGMNFAFIDGFMRYHTRADDLENMDGRSLQHQGSYILPLVRHFGNLSFKSGGGGDAVYSDILGVALLHYSTMWVLPLTGLVALLFAAVTAFGFRRGRLTFAGIARGCVAFALSVVCSSAVVGLIWWFLSFVEVRFGRGLGDDFYQSKLYLAAFCALCVAVVTWLYVRFQRRTSGEELAWGAQFCCLLALVAASLFLPGGSYLLAWTLPFCLLALAYAFAARERRRPFVLSAVMVVCMCPVIILFVPLIYQTFVAVGLGMVWVLAALMGLLLGLLVAHFALLKDFNGRLLLASATAAGVILLAIAALGFQFDRQHPKSDNVFYMMNADTGKAVWASIDAAPDEWTEQFLSASPERGTITEYTPLYSGNFLKSQTQVAPLGSPRVELLDEANADGVRTLRLRVVPSQAGTNVSALMDGAAGVVTAAEVNGRRVVNASAAAGGQASSLWTLQYWATPAEGIELTLEVKATRPVKIAVVERTDGLPQVSGQPLRPRPDYIMPSPSPASDASFVGKTFTF